MRTRSLSLSVALAVAAAVLSACNSNRNASIAPVPEQLSPQSVGAAVATPMPVTEGVGSGKVWGVDDFFKPIDGDSTSGGHGPLGSSLNGIACDSSMANSGYHVHFFLGIIVNGRQYALPDGVGLADPKQVEITYGVPNQEEYVVPPPGQKSGCYYRLHTHDPSGVVHAELPNPSGTLKVQNSYVKLGQFFSVWGHKVTTTSFDTFGGPVTVITSGQRYQGGTSSGEIYKSSYTRYTGDPNLIPIYSHEVIWLEVGSGNPSPSQLPNIVFYQEY